MYFYRTKVPQKNDLVIATIDHETDSSLFVTISEFNNMIGMIPKSRIHAKKKMYEQMIKKLKKKKTFPCIVQNMHNNQADLLVHNDTDEIMLNISKRYDAIKQIITMIMFCCKELDISYDSLSDSKVFDLLQPLNITADMIDQSILSQPNELYGQILADPKILSDQLDLSENQNTLIFNLLKNQITEANAVYTLDFQLKMINNSDQISELKNIFTKILNHPCKPLIRYISAPTYQMILSEDRFDEMESYIKQMIDHDTIFVFNKDNMVVSCRTYRIQYPYQI